MANRSARLSSKNSSRLIFIGLALLFIQAQEVSFAQTIKLELPLSTSSYRFKVEKKESESGVAKALEAVRSYDIDDGKCSLVVTSKSCHALTAAHCFQRLLTKQGKVEWQVLSSGKEPLQMGYIKNDLLPFDLEIGSTFLFKFLTDGGVSRYSQGSQSIDLSDSQKRTFGAQMQIDRYNRDRAPGTPVATGIEISIESKSATLLGLGRGFSNRTVGITDFEHPAHGQEMGSSQSGVMSDPDSYNKFVRESRGLDLADFALLKLPEENCTCVKSGDLTDDEDVIVAGFSHDAVAQSKLLRASGKVEYGSSVVPYSYGDQCYALGSQGEELTKNLNLLGKVIVYAAVGYRLHQSDEMYRAMLKHLKDRIIVTNARAAPGASGGAMLNSKGQLVGITTLVMQHVSGQKTSGIRITEIKDQLKSLVDEKVLSDAFQCD